MSTHSVRLRLPHLVLFAVLLSPVPTMVQQGLILEQSVTAVYGESLTFSAIVSPALQLDSAELTVHVPNNDPAVIPANIVQGANIVASTTVSVASLGLPPAATLQYQWTFQDSSGNLQSGDITAYRYADTSVPWDWETTSQKSVTIYTTGLDQSSRDAVIVLATNAQSASVKSLGRDQNTPIAVYIYPSLASLAASLRAHNRVVHDWVAAYAIPDQGIIFVAATPGPEMFDSLRRDISHEIMHLTIYDLAGNHYENIPAWFGEGMALNTSPETDTSLANVLTQALQNRVLLSTQALCVSSFSQLDPHDAALAYAQSASLVAYITNRYGPSQIPALMTAYSNGLSCSEGVQLALGITLTDLEQQWLRSLSVSAARPTSQNVPLMAWGLIWLVSAVISLLFIAPQPKLDSDQPLFTTQPSLPRVSTSEEDI